MEWHTLIYCFLGAWFFTSLDPLQRVIEKFFSRYETNKVLELAYQMLSCFYCFSLWLTLTLTFDPFSALLVSFTAYNYELWRENK